jgi:glycosidase
MHPAPPGTLARLTLVRLALVRLALVAAWLAAWLAACAAPAGPPTAVPVAAVTGRPAGTAGYPWWNDTVFYEIFVRSFYDSDGDGVGDLRGLSAKLDYLNDGDPAGGDDLGVTGLWLMPIHPAASYHGYDVTDYTAVNPEFGTLADFRELLDQAHARGMRVIIDLVPNHTSREHPWFVAAQDPDSPYRDWYVWSDEDHAGDSVWHPTERGDYYYGYFWSGMPDLNYANPAVGEAMREIVRYWLVDVGVDGFRVDAAQHLIEEGTVRANSDATHAWFAALRPFVRALAPEALMLGEVWSDSVLASKYVAAGEFDLVFDFELAGALVSGAGTGRAGEPARLLARDARLFPRGQFAAFIGNHDMNRVVSSLRGDLTRARAAATLLFSAPGVPFVYYGEEIGQLGRKPDEQIRTPLQWSAQPHAGFTTGTPWIEPYSDYLKVTSVAAQRGDPESLLSHYRRLIALRAAHAALRVGDLTVLATGHPAVFASLRAGAGEQLLVLVNLGDEPVREYALSLDEGPLAGRYRLAALLGAGPFEPLAAGADGGLAGYRPLAELPPGGAWIIQLQPEGQP